MPMKTKGRVLRPKHVPQRTCVTCRTVNAKRGMVRIVRTPAGAVEVDPTGKRSGRGAYLCRTHSCWTAALQRQSLEHALKTVISLEDKAALQAYSDTLPESEGDPAGPTATPETPEPGNPPGSSIEAAVL